jgi:3-methyladenine DNA glycosylase/8-oxoguanine DNA glycosylase
MVLDGFLRQPEQGSQVQGARTSRAIGREPVVVMTTFELPLRGPAGEPVDLARTLNSHGFADLSPVALDEEANVIEFTVRVAGGSPRRVRVGAGSRGKARVDVLGPRPGVRAIEAARSGAQHVLRLDQDLSGFYERAREDPDLAWVTAGAGRMIQSPTVFEDVIKTVCTTNCTWSATVRMVDALVGELGEPAIGGNGPLTNAFPTAETMAAAPGTFYRDVVRAGYRGAYLIELSRRVASGEVDLDALAAATGEELSDDELERTLVSLPGVGPYAAAHIMMTIGRNSRLILDSWTRPTYARVLGRTKPVADATIQRRFRRYGDHAGLAFWLFVTQDWVS